MISECVKRCANHYQAFEQAKSDCDEAVQSEIDLLVSESSERIAAVTKKAIKKAAKAIASGKSDALKTEADALSDVIEQSVM